MPGGGGSGFVSVDRVKKPQVQTEHTRSTVWLKKLFHPQEKDQGACVSVLTHHVLSFLHL